MDLFERMITLHQGESRSRVMLQAHWIEESLVVYLFNENAHIGAVAVGEFDHATGRTSTSVITRLGHKDYVVAQKAAYRIGKSTKKPVCVIAGIHVNEITQEEISETTANADKLVSALISRASSF